MPEIDNNRNRLIGEPLTRPDGHRMTAWEVGRDLYLKVSAPGYSIGAYFPEEDVLYYGFGDFDQGVDTIAQACYKSKLEDLPSIEIEPYTNLFI